MTGRLADLPHTPGEHFKLHFFRAILQLRERLLEARPPDEHATGVGFLDAYFAQLGRVGHADARPGAQGAWDADLLAWERATPGHLPLRALREAAGLDAKAMGLLFAIGLVEEDPRFASLFDALQGRAGRDRPTPALLVNWWDGEGPGDVRAALRQLLDLGLCEPADGAQVRPDTGLQVAPLAWDLLRGDTLADLGRGVRHLPREALTPLDELIAPPELVASLRALPALIADGDVRTVIVRGPRAGGRKTVLGALAAATGRGALAFGRLGAGEGVPRLAGALATLLHAVPVVELRPRARGDRRARRGRAPSTDRSAIALGRQGGAGGPVVDGAITLVLGLPDAPARRRHWAAGLGETGGADLDALAGRFRMTGGNIRRAARLARSAAALDGRRPPAPADVRSAGRALGREPLDTLAVALPPAGDWSQLAVGRPRRARS